MPQLRVLETRPTAIVVPCYNEAARLDLAAVRAFLARHQHLDLLFVDDGSSDQTATKLAELAGEWPHAVRAFRLERNCGKAEAVRRGMLRAAELGYSHIGFWDADLATPLEAIPDFVAVLDRHLDVQVVWGTRLPLLGHQIQREPRRRLLGRLFSKSSALAVGVSIRDALCGAKLFRHGPLFDQLVGKSFSSRWIFDVEILARLKQGLARQRDLTLQGALYEFPLDAWFEIPGSKVRLKDFVRAAFELLSLALRYRAGLSWKSESPTSEVALLDIEPVRSSLPTSRAA